MKIFSCACCATVFNIFFGMKPNEQQVRIESEVRQSPQTQRMLQAPRQPSEHEMLMKEVQAIFMQQSLDIEKRLQAWSKVDPHFDMNPILFNDERMSKVESSGMSPEKKKK